MVRVSLTTRCPLYPAGVQLHPVGPDSRLPRTSAAAETRIVQPDESDRISPSAGEGQRSPGSTSAAVPVSRTSAAGDRVRYKGGARTNCNMDLMMCRGRAELYVTIVSCVGSS